MSLMLSLDLKGRKLTPVTFPIERSKLAELARALGDDDPVWWSEDAATQAGFDGVPMPPTVWVLADHWRPHGALDQAVELGADLGRLLHGEASWEVLEPIRVGVVLTATSEVADIVEREGARGGRMTLLTLTTRFTDPGGTVVAMRADTLIEVHDR